jgi:hypothetical protein
MSRNGSALAHGLCLPAVLEMGANLGGQTAIEAEDSSDGVATGSRAMQDASAAAGSRV